MSRELNKWECSLLFIIATAMAYESIGMAVLIGMALIALAIDRKG